VTVSSEFVDECAPIEVAEDDGVSVIVIRGEHDLSTAAELRARMEQLRVDQGPFVVDLTEATFIDSAVLGVLIGEHDRAASEGTAVGFAVGPGSGYGVRRIIDLAGVAAVLPISDTRAAAVSRIRT
jgi:anti-sigma B factor antagonist